MSEQTGTAAPETGEQGAGNTETGEGEQQKPTETVDFWKQKARDNEKRAKANADAAKRLAEIEDAQKTEAQKAADALAAAQSDAEAARAEALRFRIASKFKVSDEDAELFLTGTDEETLTRQAQRLTERASDARKGGNHVAREGGNSTSAPTDEQAFVRDLFTAGA